MTEERPEGIEKYDHPAGGWDALKAVAKTLAHQQIVAQGTMTLLKANQPEGFDCPGCAWPDPNTPHRSNFAKTAPRRSHGNRPPNDPDLNFSHSTRSPNCGSGPTTSSRMPEG